MQSIIGTIAEMKAAYEVVNNDGTNDETADEQMALAYEKEDKLCRLLKRLNDKAEKPDDDERLALYELMMDPHDPPEFPDNFRNRLYDLLHSL